VSNVWSGLAGLPREYGAPSPPPTSRFDGLPEKRQKFHKDCRDLKK
jgi:hypothetical protein